MAQLVTQTRTCVVCNHIVYLVLLNLITLIFAHNIIIALQVVETPHFRVTLPSGHMFCYNIQGQKDAVYNLISSKHFEMNAGFSTDALNSSDSWMDSIGVTVFHKGQETTLIKFSASAWEVNIGESVSLEADQVDKITVSKGRLMILPMYPKEFPDISPSIEVYFSDLDLDFSVHYMESIYEDHKRAQVSLYWRSTGAIHSGAHGIVGELDNTEQCHVYSIKLNSRVIILLYLHPVIIMTLLS